MKSKDDTLYLSAADFKEIPPAKLLEILKYTLALVGLKNAIHSGLALLYIVKRSRSLFRHHATPFLRETKTTRLKNQRALGT